MSGGYSISTSWRKSVVGQLQARNQQEVAPFTDLVTLHHRLSERSNGLQSENAQLKLLTEKLKDEIKDLAAGGRGGGAASDAAARATISMLERKLFAVQEELTELHRKKSDNAEQFIEQGKQQKASQALVEEKTAQLNQCTKNLSEAQERINQLTNSIQELKFTNQLLKDEHQTLQLAWNTKERALLDVKKEMLELKREMEETKKENSSLVDQIMEYKGREVYLMNKENDLQFLKRQHQESVQNQLAEAAGEHKNVVLEPSSATVKQPVGQQGLCQYSAVCQMVRIPTKAYLTFEAHDGEVNAIKWSPHGLIVATGGSDRKIKLWDVSKGTNTLCATLRGSNGSVMSVDYDSAGSLLLAASYGDFACRVWTTDDLKLRHTFTGHNKQVLSAKFMEEDSNKFVSASHDRTLRIWDLRSKACISTKFAGSSCNDVVCAGTSIISGHFDCTLKFWDVRSGNTPVKELKLAGKIASLDASSNGNWLLACTRDDAIKLIDMRMMVDGEVKSFQTDGFRVGCDWTRATFSPDSEYVGVGSANGTVYIWNVRQCSRPETVLRNGHGSSVVVAVAWQPSGNVLTTCDRNKNVVVWADI